MAYWSGVDVLVRIIRLALNRCWNIWWIFWCLLFPMVNTFSWKGGGEVGMGVHYYVITKWPKFLSSSYLFSFGSPFSFIEPSNLTSSNQLHKYHKKCSPECFPCPPAYPPTQYVWYQLFRFRLSELYVRLRQVAFII